MDDRLQEVFAAVVPSDETFQFKITDESHPENPKSLAKFLASLSHPVSYQVFLVNASGHDISEIGMQSGGFEGAAQLNVVRRKLRPLEKGQALLIEQLDFEMLDFVLWYHLDISFTDHNQLKAVFSINKAYSLRKDRFQLCTVLGKEAYHFPLALRSKQTD